MAGAGAELVIDAEALGDACDLIYTQVNGRTAQPSGTPVLQVQIGLNGVGVCRVLSPVLSYSSCTRNEQMRVRPVMYVRVSTSSFTYPTGLLIPRPSATEKKRNRVRGLANLDGPCSIIVAKVLKANHNTRVVSSKMSWQTN